MDPTVDPTETPASDRDPVLREDLRKAVRQVAAAKKNYEGTLNRAKVLSADPATVAAFAGEQSSLSALIAQLG